ncbi:MAG: hypothetical protein JSC189_001260 [Candidatus Tokpelaia sp. JSC189]|nr:MAG: hypothetical protein JSC189_001260 [Candidatus Tokpelaia sp. JSC189]
MKYFANRFKLGIEGSDAIFYESIEPIQAW